MGRPATERDVKGVLDSYAGKRVPGLQYIVTGASGLIFEYAGGFADIQNAMAMTPDVTMMAYSMTKTFTAIAVLQLVERGQLALEGKLDSYVETPYRGKGITIRQLLNHTSGIPNPIPLRWVHLAGEASLFDEGAALAGILRKNPKLASAPGRRFAYSNIGYWLLGKIAERASGQAYVDYMRNYVLEPLWLRPEEMDFAIHDGSRHAKGYLAKYSLMNLAKGLVTDRKFWGGYEGKWLCLKSHYLNGPAFGGLVGTARGFAVFLQNQLRKDFVLLGPEARRLLETQQTDGAGRPIPMTLGWHCGKVRGKAYLFKEGGGGGFHSEMRLYPAQGIASVAMANDTGFNSTGFLNRMDAMVVGW